MTDDDNDGVFTWTTDAERDEILAGVSAEMAYWRDAPARFFRAWKDGVALAGVGYFGDGTQAGFDAATDKNALAPRIERVRAGLGLLSGGERRFLAALYSFYNDQAAADMWADAFPSSPDNIGATISNLDLARRRVLAELTVNYTGW